MALSSVDGVFGVHGLTFVNRQNGLPFGKVRVIGEAALSVTGETIPLRGGSNPWPWEVENGPFETELTMNISEYSNLTFELFAGRAPTVNAAEPGGFASALDNVAGTTVADAVTGVSTVAITTAGDVPFTAIVIEAVNATDVNLYAYTNVNFSRGSIKEYVDDSLLINATPLTIPASGAVAVPNFGIELNGGSAPAMNPGDTAIFYLRPENLESREVVIGNINDQYKEYGLIILAQAQATGKLFEVEAYRVTGRGLPINFTSFEWSGIEQTLNLSYDSAKGGVYAMREVLQVL